MARAFHIGLEGMELRNIRDRYRFMKKIGSGATAEIYLAWDGLLDRKVAVKYGENKKLLLQEARYLTAFQARFFPVLYEYWEEEDRSFLMMEYIQGENLAERFHRIGQYTEEEVFRIAQGIAEALDYLHTGEEACIYGDVKAENIMVQPDGVVRLVDFGALSPVSGRMVRRSLEMSTEQGEEVRHRGGTPLYAPPELWKGRADRRSDIYALGRLMKVLLQMNGERELSPKAERVLTGCLQALPEYRYQSMKQLLEALESYFCDKF